MGFIWFYVRYTVLIFFKALFWVFCGLVKKNHKSYIMCNYFFVGLLWENKN